MSLETRDRSSRYTYSPRNIWIITKRSVQNTMNPRRSDDEIYWYGSLTHGIRSVSWRRFLARKNDEANNKTSKGIWSAETTICCRFISCGEKISASIIRTFQTSKSFCILSMYWYIEENLPLAPSYTFREYHFYASYLQHTFSGNRTFQTFEPIGCQSLLLLTDGI